MYTSGSLYYLAKTTKQKKMDWCASKSIYPQPRPRIKNGGGGGGGGGRGLCARVQSAARSARYAPAWLPPERPAAGSGGTGDPPAHPDSDTDIHVSASWPRRWSPSNAKPARCHVRSPTRVVDEATADPGSYVATATSRDSS